jgi:hypothetical protein
MKRRAKVKEILGHKLLIAGIVLGILIIVFLTSYLTNLDTTGKLVNHLSVKNSLKRSVQHSNNLPSMATPLNSQILLQLRQ